MLEMSQLLFVEGQPGRRTGYQPKLLWGCPEIVILENGSSCHPQTKIESVVLKDVLCLHTRQRTWLPLNQGGNRDCEMACS